MFRKKVASVLLLGASIAGLALAIAPEKAEARIFGCGRFRIFHRHCCSGQQSCQSCSSGACGSISYSAPSAVGSTYQTCPTCPNGRCFAPGISTGNIGTGNIGSLDLHQLQPQPIPPPVPTRPAAEVKDKTAAVQPSVAQPVTVHPDVLPENATTPYPPEIKPQNFTPVKGFKQQAPVFTPLH